MFPPVSIPYGDPKPIYHMAFIVFSVDGNLDKGKILPPYTGLKRALQFSFHIE